MVSFPSGMLHSNDNERSTKTRNTINESHKHEAEQKKSGTKEHVLTTLIVQRTQAELIYAGRGRDRVTPEGGQIPQGKRV